MGLIIPGMPEDELTQPELPVGPQLCPGCQARQDGKRKCAFQGVFNSNWNCLTLLLLRQRLIRLLTYPPAGYDERARILTTSLLQTSDSGSAVLTALLDISDVQCTGGWQWAQLIFSCHLSGPQLNIYSPTIKLLVVSDSEISTPTLLEVGAIIGYLTRLANADAPRITEQACTEWESPPAGATPSPEA